MNRRFSVVLLLLGIFSVITSSTALCGDYVVIIMPNVNIRSGPSTENAIIERAAKGDIFEWISENLDWYRIAMFSGEDRYVCEKQSTSEGGQSELTAKLTPSELLPGHNMELPPSEEKRRSIFRNILSAKARAKQEADEIIPSSISEERHGILQKMLEDRMILEVMHTHDIQPALYRVLIEEGTAKNW
jgi:SH3-like domain-containing protein